MSGGKINTIIDESIKRISEAQSTLSTTLVTKEIGTVLSIYAGIVSVSGLPNVGYEELLKFPHGLHGIAYNIDEDEIGVIFLGDDSLLHVGDVVERTGRVMDVPVGENLIGRIINPLGVPLDDYGVLVETERYPIERSAPPIMNRSPVNVPMQTGIKVVDALIPIGRGQRELIIGDRQTGKTSIAIDTILNQSNENVICIYCAIGKRGSAIAKVVNQLKEGGAMDYSFILATEGSDPPGLQYIAPYAAMSMGEYFMEKGKDVLIVFDDLTNHARSYRELSLLLRRPPGREAFPGDIFYTHSRLLERSTHLNKEFGGGSLTALPIVETEAQNLAAYIPTNLISITDGQIYLSPKLFELAVLPAIDIGKSVSRVGGKAQLNTYRTVAGNLKLSYSQFEELESFARFGTKLDKRTHEIIAHGNRIRACLKQSELIPWNVAEQITVLLALKEGLFRAVSLDDMEETQNSIRKVTGEISAITIDRIKSNGTLGREGEMEILDLVRKTLGISQVEPKNTAGTIENKIPI